MSKTNNNGASKPEPPKAPPVRNVKSDTIIPKEKEVYIPPTVIKNNNG